MPKRQHNMTESKERGAMEGAADDALSQLEEKAARGAQAVGEMAYRAADQIDWTKDYLRKASRWTAERAKDTSRGIERTVRENPVPAILAAAAVAFGIGYLVRGKRI